MNTGLFLNLLLAHLVGDFVLHLDKGRFRVVSD